MPVFMRKHKFTSTLRYCIVAMLVLLANCQPFEDISYPKDLNKEMPMLPEDAAKQKLSSEQMFSDDSKKVNINRIFIINRPISEKKEPVANFVNYFHWTTEKFIIYNELMFHENTTTKVEFVNESARLLRSLPVIKDAAIYLVPVNASEQESEPEAYDAYIYTRDRISSTVRWGLTGSGGYNKLNLEAGETNIFGRMYELKALYERENMVDSFALAAGQSRLLETNLYVNGLYGLNFVDGNANYQTISAAFGRPFIRTTDKYAWGASFIKSRGTQYRFLGSEIETVTDPVTGEDLSMTLGRDYIKTEIFGSRGWGRLDRLELKAGLGQKIDQFYFIDPAHQYKMTHEKLAVSSEARDEFLPYHDRRRYGSFGVSYKSIDYLTRKNYQKYLFTEDLYRGYHISTTLWRAIPDSTLPDNFTTTETQLLYVFDKNSHRNVTTVERGAEFQIDRETVINDRFMINNRYYYFFDSGTIAARIFYGQGNNLERDSRFEMGGDFIRGYPFRYNTGNTAWLTSLEYRTPPLRFSYFAFGAVAFADIGQVEKHHFQKPTDLIPHPAVGIGLRSGIVEFDDNIFRLDFGFPLRNPEIGLFNMFSFGLSHSF